MTGIPRLFVAGLLIASLLASACGETDTADPGSGRTDPGPDEPVACYNPVAPPEDTTGLTPCPDAPGAPEGPQRLEPRDDLVEVRPHPWERVEVGESDRVLDVIFWGGVEECYGVDRVEVEERRSRVIATLYTGTVPTVEACIDLAVEQYVRVRLDAPLGDRRVVDGAA